MASFHESSIQTDGKKNMLMDLSNDASQSKELQHVETHQMVFDFL